MRQKRITAADAVIYIVLAFAGGLVFGAASVKPACSQTWPGCHFEDTKKECGR